MEDRSWLDHEAYSFVSRSLDLTAERLHYVDEGSGQAVLMIHGNPTWSFLYRHVSGRPGATHRCVAPDHLGFGLSDEPSNWSYTPAAHAHNLARLVAHLDPRDLTLVVQD